MPKPKLHKPSVADVPPVSPTAPEIATHEAVTIEKDVGPKASVSAVVVVPGFRTFLADNWKVLAGIAFAIVSAAQSKYHFLDPDDWTQIMNYAIGLGILTGHQFAKSKTSNG